MHRGGVLKGGVLKGGVLKGGVLKGGLFLEHVAPSMRWADGGTVSRASPCDGGGSLCDGGGLSATVGGQSRLKAT